MSDDLQGDLMTFGKHFDATHVAGSCTSPLSLTTQREKINRYSKLGNSGTSPTQIWLSASGKTYRLTIDHPGNKPDGNPNPVLGQDDMNVKLTLEEASNCTGPVFARTFTANLDFTLWTDFLMEDEDRGTATAPSNGSNDGVDSIAGFWNFKDIADVANCDSPHPFSGQGWEGNYDGAVNGGSLPAGVTILSEDPFCNSGDASCNIKFATTFDSLGRPLDRGDVIPIRFAAGENPP